MKTVGGFTIFNTRKTVTYIFGAFVKSVKENLKERTHEIYLLDGIEDEDIINFQIHFGAQFVFYRYRPENEDSNIKELYIKK